MMLRLPDVRRVTPPIIFIVVDFTAPLGPSRPKDSPAGTVNEMPSTAATPPYVFVRFPAVMTVPDGGLPGRVPAGRMASLCTLRRLMEVPGLWKGSFRSAL